MGFSVLYHISMAHFTSKLYAVVSSQTSSSINDMTIDCSSSNDNIITNQIIHKKVQLIRSLSYVVY